MCIESKQRIAILTSPNQWFVPYAQELQHRIAKAQLYFSHLEMKESYEVVFILSYHQIIPQEFLDKNRLNLVIHASPLPKGKGWSPLFWQVLEGKDSIVFSLFNAESKADSGEIYLQKTLHLNGLELYEELREKQAKMCQEMCLEFLEGFPKMNPKVQRGEPSFYPKRTAKDSELDITKSIESQFHLLRIVSNEEFPAFFYKNGKKFVLKIYADSISSTSAIRTLPSVARWGIIESVCLELENYVDLLEREQREILLIRNDGRVKSNLYHQHEISQKEHFDFIESLKHNPTKQYFAIKFCAQIIGSINFDLKNIQEVEFGFFANPNLNVSGIGRVLEQISLFYVFNVLGTKRLRLEVFKENRQVVNLHKKFGFRICGEKIIRDKEVLEMSLER